MVTKPIPTEISPSNVRARAVAALADGFKRSNPSVLLDQRGYAAHWIDNVFPGIESKWFQGDLEAGDGNELKDKFRAPHSSSALAVNVFARFKQNPSSLPLPKVGDIQAFAFEQKCPIGIQGRKPPNLDLLLKARQLVGIESKCIEYLSLHRATFSPAYDEQIHDDLRKTSWFAQMHRLIKDPDAYRHLDAAQLVKHAFGLSRASAGQPVSLIYVYWEPSNAGQLELFAAHRAEIKRFSSEVSGSSPSFESMSYPDLWNYWGLIKAPSWLANHVIALRRRYDVEI